MADLTPYDIVYNLLGLHEESGDVDNYFVMWCLSLTNVPTPFHDETPWCSALGVGICKLCGIKGSTSAAARSWIGIGTEININDARSGYDFVVIKRGTGPQPGREVKNAPGHFTFFGGLTGTGSFYGLGGNQGDKISISSYPIKDILYIGRLG